MTDDDRLDMIEELGGIPAEALTPDNPGAILSDLLEALGDPNEYVMASQHLAIFKSWNHADLVEGVAVAIRRANARIQGAGMKVDGS